MADNLADMVDKAIPSGGVVNCEHLHKLLHVIVHNLNTVSELKMDYKCSAAGKSGQPMSTKSKENLAQIHGKVKDLADMSVEQRRMLTELECKINSLEGELNKVASVAGADSKQCGKCGKSISIREREGPASRSSGKATGRNASKRSLTKSASKRSLTKSASKRSLINVTPYPTPPKTSKSVTSYKSHSCLTAAERGGDWSKSGKAGAGGQRGSAGMSQKQLDEAVSTQMKNIHIPELKKWVEDKLKTLAVKDNLPQRIDKLVKEQMSKTVVPDLKKMIEAMIVQVQKDIQLKSSTAESLCMSCQQSALAGSSQVDSQDCLCVIKRKLKNASKMKVKKD